MICPIQIEDESQGSDSQKDFYDVEFIFGKKMKRREIFYAVKWLGYSIKQMTWEPRSNFTNQSSYLIQRFESQMAYQIFLKVFNPKKETIRIHVKQRFYQIYSLDPQTRNIFNQLENQSIFDKNHEQVYLGNELLKAKKIIDGQKKNLQKVQRKQENEIKNQDILIANLLNKQTIKRKKQESKLELPKDNKYTFPPIIQENQIKELKYSEKEKNQHQNKNFESEIFKQLIEHEQQEQFKLNDFQLKHKDALNSYTQNSIKRINKRVDDFQIIIQPSQKTQNVTNIMKIKKNERSEPEESNKIQERKIRQLKQSKKEFEYVGDEFDIEISFNEELMIQVKTSETADHSKFLKQQQKSQIESKEFNFLQNCDIKEQIDLQKVDSPELIYCPKFKLEREYLNEIIVNQKKKELEIYKSGNIISVIKKDAKSYTQARTSQQLSEEIKKIQLEKIASNKTSRCSVPIIPRVKEKEVQIDENEFPTFEMTIYNEQIQPMKSPRSMIESIITHHMLNNLILFKCLYENGQKYYLDFQSLSLNSPTLLLDYMRVNFILI